MKRIARFLIVGPALLSFLAWPLALAATRTVTIPAKAFDPATISITVGDTVQWVDQDPNRVHTVTATTAARQKGEDFSSSTSTCKIPLFDDGMHDGDQFTPAFHSVGTVVDYCKVHGSDAPYPQCAMCGVVKLSKKKSSGGGSPTPSTSMSPSPTGSGSPSASPTGTATTPGSSGSALAGGSGTGGGATAPVAIAAVAVAVLGGPRFLVYRTMIRR